MTSTPRQRHSSPRCRAFSLLEVLVAVSLLAVIISALLLTFGQTQRAFRRGVNQVDVLEGGRTATLMLGRDLQEAYPTGFTNSVDFLALLPDSVAPLQQALPGGETRWDLLERLAFVSRMNDDWYVTAYGVLDEGKGVGALYRWRVRTTQAQAASNVVFAAATWNPDPAIDSRVIDGVIHFQITAFATVDGTNGMIVPWAPLGWLRGQGNLFPDFRTTNAVPTSVELELGIMEPQALAAFRARTEVASFNARAYLANRANRVHLFRQRVPIRATLPQNSSLFAP